MKPHFLFTVAILVLSSEISLGQNYRSYDGSGNNLINQTWGSAGSNQSRITGNGYGDSISAPGGLSRMNPRAISNALMDQSTSIPGYLGLSDYWWTFGQFIDHDITLVKDDTSEFYPVMVPMGDPVFDSASTGTQMIPMFRSQHDPSSGTSSQNPRLHINSISSWIDASSVYGSDSARALWLRTGTGGKLKMSANDLLPFNTVTGELNDPIDFLAPAMANENPNIVKFFVAGDIRANEQPSLTCLHTLFVREHNRLCDSLVVLNPNWNDEQLYQKARKIVGALIQHITYYEWLPAAGLTPDPYIGYINTLDPSISNVFSGSAYRLGHTMVNEQLIRIDQLGDSSAFGPIPLKEGFFNPPKIYAEGGITPILQGLATQMQQSYDLQISGSLRNFLFSAQGFFPGLDLAAININRGRERGLVNFNQMRRDLGLTAYTTFTQLNSDTTVSNQMNTIYAGDIDDIDAWMGMLAEEHLSGSAFGELVHKLIKEQFERLRDADRFYYVNDPGLSIIEQNIISNTLLSDVIKRNTDIFNIQDSVFFAEPYNAISSVMDITTSDVKVLTYPNPFTDNLHVRVFGSHELMTFDLFDYSGRLIYRSSFIDESVFDLHSICAQGLYLLRISSEGSNQIFNGKIVKQ